ncbi:helix-turn-helix domain-containing protein [Streptomyces bambusae]|uniref:helix-turn-helix domain-containing protein n=1 Tax=Streptomyces bambusae TaxID=1550616 RepID=UPI001CFF1072|nr:helix-turn-helix domain-containing protein [Streptomyces bambusae]
MADALTSSGAQQRSPRRHPATLRRCDAKESVTAIARHLGIGRSTLYRTVASYDERSRPLEWCIDGHSVISSLRLCGEFGRGPCHPHRIRRDLPRRLRLHRHPHPPQTATSAFKTTTGS